MDRKIVLVAETGSDIVPEVAEKYGVYLAPMHVAMGNQTLDDGSFPASEVVAYYEKTGTVPRTSGCTPEDFVPVFKKIREDWPEASILHLAYSAVTTCSFQSAVIAAEGLDYIRSVDVKQVSVGQYLTVIEMARIIAENPQMTLDEATAKAEEVAGKVHMCFIPHNLKFLRAGGRVSNATALVGNLLHIRPCIEIIDGKLIAAKKYRGTLKSCITKLMQDFIAAHHFRRDKLYLIWSVGLADEMKQLA